jgi:menaquinone-dependent protoporphyrinogen IX oxidase/phosphohistidine swiveling domain-containing protein
VDAVRRCWSSVWTARALAYRARQGTPHTEVAGAVVVQRMVPADVAGVLFTADPVTGRRDRVVLEGVRGLGDALVSGRVTPQRWVVDAGTRLVLEGPDGANQQLLDDARVRELAGLGLRAAALAGTPQDLEWAIAGERCWLLQSRPITSLFPLPSEPPAGPGLRVYMPLTLAAQGLTEPMTPAGGALFAALASAATSLWSTGRRQEEQPGWVSTAAGRLFYDMTPLLASPRLGRYLADGMALKDPATSAALREWLDREGHRLARSHGAALPVGLAVWGAREVPGLVAAAVAPGRARRRLLARAENQIDRLSREAAALPGARQQVEFVLAAVPRRALDVVWAQLPPLYVGLLAGALAAWLCERWLGSSTGLEPVRRWLPHDPTLAMGAALARLAQACAETGGEPSASGPGMAEFLATFGHRAPDREIDLGLPRFRDDPSYVVQLVRGYLTAGDPADLLARQQRGAEEAAAAARDLVTAVRRARGRLPALLLRAVLARYRALGGLRERPKFDLVRVLAVARGALQQVGATLVAAGRLADVDDVFFLDPADLRAAVAGTAPDLSVRADRRRREYQRELGRRSVPLILSSDGETVYGPAAPPESTPGTLHGTGVSPGVHDGVVRVLDSPVGAALAPGEVLVAASTDPGWTPLFLLAGALVMEVGGVISHGAIVAREYGIPAVATVPDATRRLRTGQRVRVDGGAGTVTLLDDSDRDERPLSPARTAQEAAGMDGTSRVLVGYATGAGSTQGIAERIAAGLRRATVEVVVRPLDPDLDPTGFDAFVLGSAVHDQRWLPAAMDFLHTARPSLGDRPLWVFSVVGVAPRGPIRRALVRQEVQKIDRTFPPGLTPREHGVFAGVVATKGLPVWGKLFWLAVGGRPGDHRDWPAIDRWAAEIAAALPHRRAASTAIQLEQRTRDSVVEPSSPRERRASR